MAMTYATITGRITQPGTDVGVRCRVTATPGTTAGALRFPSDGRVTWGPQTAETDDAGNIPSGALRIPLGSADGASVVWRFDAEPIDPIPSLPSRWQIARTPITADTTIAAIANVQLTAVTPDLVESIGSFRDQAQAAAAAAQAVGTTNDTIIAGRITTPGSATATALSASIAEKAGEDAANSVSPLRVNLRPPMRSAAAAARGGVVFQFDDGTIDHYNIAVPMLEAVGGRGTFAVNNSVGASYLTAAQMQEMQGRGHEIAAHGKAHLDFTTLTDAQRVTEWEDNRTFLETTCGLGAGSVRTFIYPFSGHNVAVDQQSYLRWDRTFAGEDVPCFRSRMDRDLGIAKGRITAKTGEVTRVQAAIRQAAQREEFLTIVIHHCDGSDLAGYGITQAQLSDLINLCASLGVPMLTSREAFPASTPVVDPGFTDMTQWVRLDRDAGNTVDPVVDTQQAGFPTAYSLKITSNNTTLFPNATSRVKYPYLHPNQEYTFSCRFRQEKTDGNGGGYIAIREYDNYGVKIGSDIGSGSQTAVGSTAWKQLSKAWTPGPLARSFSIIFAASPFTGSAYFAHPHVGPTRYGALG